MPRNKTQYTSMPPCAWSGRCWLSSTMRRIQQKRYMSLTALVQTKTMINANVINAGEATQEVA